jgi:hypothetical protein
VLALGVHHVEHLSQRRERTGEVPDIAVDVAVLVGVELQSGELIEHAHAEPVELVVTCGQRCGLDAARAQQGRPRLVTVGAQVIPAVVVVSDAERRRRDR